MTQTETGMPNNQPHSLAHPKPVNPTPPVQPTASAKKIKKLKKHVRRWFFTMWRSIITMLFVGLLVSTVLGFRIGSLTKGISTPEKNYIASVDSGREIMQSPVNIVHKIPTYALFKLQLERPAFYRGVSAAFAALAVLSGFFILKKWYSLRIAILGSWLLLSSAWLLHIARLATPEASLLLIMPLLWTATWMYTTPKKRTALAVLAMVSAVSFYIPGFMWLVLSAVLWQRKTIKTELKKLSRWLIAAGAAGIIVLLVPLALAAIKDPHQLLLVMGLPLAVPNITALGQNALNLPVQLLLRGPDDPVRWLGRLPLLDIFSSTMLVLGVYSLRRHARLARSQLLIGSSVLFSVLIVAGGLVTTAALLPLLYLLIARGVAFMLRQWFSVFPRNPVAHALATTAMSIIILLVSFYNVNHYFIAWPQTPATQQVFTHTP